MFLIPFISTKSCLISTLLFGATALFRLADSTARHLHHSLGTSLHLMKRPTRISTLLFGGVALSGLVQFNRRPIIYITQRGTSLHPVKRPLRISWAWPPLHQVPLHWGQRNKGSETCQECEETFRPWTPCPFFSFFFIWCMKTLKLRGKNMNQRICSNDLRSQTPS